MTKYKIVASDLDGTLLNSYSEISAENFDAITELDRRGVMFVPATGRSFAEIPEIIKQNPHIRYFIHSSGAVVYDKLTEERVSFCFPTELSCSILKTIFGLDCHLTIRRYGKMLCSDLTMNEECFNKYRVFKPHGDMLLDIGEPVHDFEKAMLSADEIEMIALFFADDGELARARNYFSSIPDINIASACPYNIELTYKEAGKGNALAALSEKLGFSVDRTIAVGDSENDLPMISAAGLGLAVSNATENLKAHADQTICSNDEHAVKFILDNYCS